MRGRSGAIDVGCIGAQQQRWLCLAWQRLKMVRLTDTEQNSVGRGFNNSANGRRHRLDALQKGELVEEAMIDGDGKTFAVGRKEPVKPGLDAHISLLGC